MLLRQMLGSWPVHAAALSLGTAAYADAAWIARTREELPARAEALDREQRSQHHPGQPRQDRLDPTFGR